MNIGLKSSEITKSLAYFGQLEGADMSVLEKATAGMTGTLDLKQPVTVNGVTEALDIDIVISPDVPATPTK